MIKTITRSFAVLLLLVVSFTPSFSEAFWKNFETSVSIGQAEQVGEVLGATSGLTESQIQSILSLLRAFGADQTIINAVEGALRGTVPPTNLTESQINSILSLLQSFGAGNDIVDGALSVMRGNSEDPIQHSLTDPQVQSILSLLTSFNAASFVIQNMASFLGSGTVPTVGAGSLSISTDASSPAYKIVAGGTNETVAVFNVQSHSSETLRLEKIGISLLEPATAFSTVKFDFHNGRGDFLGSTSVVGTNRDALAHLVVQQVIHASSSERIIVNATFTDIGPGKTGRSGDFVRVKLNSSTHAVGVSTGNVAQINTGNLDTAGVRVMKSYPLVSLDTLPSTGVADGRLMRFKIQSSPYGQVSIGKIKGYIQGISGGSVSNIKLYGFTDSSYSSPVPGFGADGTLASYTSQDGFIFASPLVVPTGGTRYFEIRGSVQIANNSSLVVVTKIDGDGNFPGADGSLLPFSSFIGGADAGFVWSPNSFSNSTFNDHDWTNGYGVQGLPSSGLTQTRSGTVSTPPAPTPACSDGIDNDSDGLVDYPSDPGCSNSSDDNEQNESIPDTSNLGTYRGYLNDSLFITTENISREDALANCKLNSTNNPTKSIRCTWNGETIFTFTYVPPVAAKPSCSLAASSSYIRAGSQTVLQWTTANATSITVDQAIGSVSPVSSGSKIITVPSTRTYTATARGNGGSATCSVRIVTFNTSYSPGGGSRLEGNVFFAEP